MEYQWYHSWKDDPQHQGSMSHRDAVAALGKDTVTKCYQLVERLDTPVPTIIIPLNKEVWTLVSLGD